MSCEQGLECVVISGVNPNIPYWNILSGEDTDFSRKD